MPSLKSFRVEFDRPGATYSSGELVTGNIIIELLGDKQVRGISFGAKGEARVHWTETSNRTVSSGRSSSRTDHYTNHEEYFNFKYNIVGTSRSDSRITIPAGFNKYPFEFQLPYNIPSSFEHRIGQIRYTVKAVIDRPWKFDHECKTAFTIISSLDLNQYREKCLGIDDEANKSFCCCFISQGSMNVRIRIPSSGFVPGQSINTTFDYENSSDSVKISALCTKLIQKLTFYARVKSKNETSEIISTKTSGNIPDRGQYTSELRIPPIPPSNLDNCSIIDLAYKTVATVHVTGSHTRIERSYPVLIGTVPLYCLPSAPPLEGENIVPTAPVLEKGPATMPISMPLPMLPNSPPYPTETVIPAVLQPGPHSRLNWDIPPPSYEECTSGAQNIRDHDESNYVFGAGTPFAPRYPVFSYPTPSVHNN